VRPPEETVAPDGVRSRPPRADGTAGVARTRTGTRPPRPRH
jgi:hypothetical protein